jgi:hypothetical protein
MVVRQVARGDVVWLLGAGANLCDRPGDRAWEVGSYLPSGTELAEHLASDIDHALPERDLARVSEYFDLRCGEGPLYGRLREVFGVDYPPTSLHQFLANLPSTLAEAGFPRRNQLIVTTNYDDTLEAAFAKAGEAFDLVVYQAVGRDRGSSFIIRPTARHA